MSERNTYDSSGHISVQRSMDWNGSLVETWVLKNDNWYDGDIIDEPMVHVYIAAINDSQRVPPLGEYQHDVMTFSEVPESVQDELIEQLFHIMELRERLFKHAENDAWPKR